MTITITICEHGADWTTQAASASEDDVRAAIIDALREHNAWTTYFMDGYEPSEDDILIGEDVAIFAGDERVYIAPITVGDVRED